MPRGRRRRGGLAQGAGTPAFKTGLQGSRRGAPTAGLGAHRVNKIRPRFFLSDKSTIISETEDFKHPNS